MLSPFIKVDNEFSFKPKIFNNKNLSSNTLTSEQHLSLKVKNVPTQKLLKRSKK